MNFAEKIGTNINMRSMRISFISTFIFSMAAHAFAYFNFIPQHDSVTRTLTFADTWEVSLGRFLLPWYGKVVGNICMPWFNGMLSIIFISLIVYMVVEMLDIQEYCILVSGFLSVNLCILERINVFIYVLPTYLFSTCLACIGIYLLYINNINKYSNYYNIISICCFCCSLALYQAEIAFSISVIFLSIVKDNIYKVNIKIQLRRYKNLLILLLLSIIIYYLLYIYFLQHYNTHPPKNYNSLSKLSELTVHNIYKNIISNYKSFINYFYYGDNRIYNILLSFITVIILLYNFLNKKLYLYNYIIISISIILFPIITFSINILMRQSTLRFYMNYSIFLYYILMILIIKHCISKKNVFIKNTIYILSFITIVQNIILCNQNYTINKLIYDRTLSICTRILYDIESYKKYVPGTTKVIFIGELNRNKFIYNFKKKYKKLHRNHNLTSITNEAKFRNFSLFLGSNITTENINNMLKIDKFNKIVQKMPTYPNKGYYEMINGRMVVKLSE